MPQWPTGTGLASLTVMEQTAVATDQTDTAQTEVASTEELLDDEFLVEEISIDGMCGVY